MSRVVPSWRICKWMRITVIGILGLFGFVLFSKTNNTVVFDSILKIEIYKSILYKEDYCVIYDYWEASGEFKNGDYITLVLHATPKYLNFLQDHLDTWDGGISVSVFIPTPEISDLILNSEKVIDVNSVQLNLQEILSGIDKMKNFKNSGRISLHLFFEKKNFSTCPNIRNSGIKLDTSGELMDFQISSGLYPINPARNIARNGSKTELFISGDIEQIFCKKFEKKMKILAKKILLEEKKKFVLVHRRFEISENATLPKTKNELLKLIKNKQALPFHQKVYNRGHYIPELEKWLTNPEKNESDIQMILNYTNSEWEPQFVCDKNTPFHDDRFPFRLRSNTHLSTILCFQGYQFAIVNDLFTVHRGIKLKETGSDKMAKKRMLQKGYVKMVNKFVNELINKYPSMRNVCPLLLP